jgi:hypothetical protein
VNDNPNKWLRKSELLARAMRASNEFSEEECLEQERRAASFRNWLTGEAIARQREAK